MPETWRRNKNQFYFCRNGAFQHIRFCLKIGRQKILRHRNSNTERDTVKICLRWNKIWKRCLNRISYYNFHHLFGSTRNIYLVFDPTFWVRSGVGNQSHLQSESSSSISALFSAKRLLEFAEYSLHWENVVRYVVPAQQGFFGVGLLYEIALEMY